MVTAQPNQVAHDVICHMDIGIEQTAGRSDYDGRTYFFCANSCQARFDADPEAALRAEDAPRPQREAFDQHGSGHRMTTAQPNQTEHDVICHMDISIAESAGRSDYEGRTYYFCAMGCKREFDDDPAAALKAEDEYDHSAPMDHGMESAPPAKKPWWKFW